MNKVGKNKNKNKNKAFHYEKSDFKWLPWWVLPNTYEKMTKFYIIFSRKKKEETLLNLHSEVNLSV